MINDRNGAKLQLVMGSVDIRIESVKVQVQLGHYCHLISHTSHVQLCLVEKVEISLKIQS